MTAMTASTPPLASDHSCSGSQRTMILLCAQAAPACHSNMQYATVYRLVVAARTQIHPRAYSQINEQFKDR